MRGKKLSRLSAVPLFLVLASCGTGNEDEGGLCRSYPAKVTWEDGTVARYSFDLSTDTFYYDEPGISETWSYRDREDFIREIERPNLGLFAEYYEANVMSGYHSEVRTFDAQGRLLSAERSISDNGNFFQEAEFDSWDDEDRPVRAFTRAGNTLFPEDACEHMQQIFQYDGENNQIVIETAPGQHATSGAVCQGAGYLSAGIRRITLDEFGIVAKREFWEYGADIHVDEPESVVDRVYQVSSQKKVCM